MRRLTSIIVTACLLVTLVPLGGGLAAASPPPGKALTPRPTLDKPVNTKIDDGHDSGVVVLKFSEGTGARLRGQRFVSISGSDLSAANEVLSSYPGLKLRRLFNGRSEAAHAAEKRTLEAKSGSELADKNLFYRIKLGKKSEAAGLIDDLNALGTTEIAYAEALPSPSPVTPDYTADQGYFDPPPLGIDADYAHTVPGGSGANVRIIDVEYDWNENHEDLSKARLPGAMIPNGTPALPDQPGFDDNHGTAVLGELIADDNTFGVTGLAHDAGIGMVNQYNTDGAARPAAIDLAGAAAALGDVVLLEMQTRGAGATDEDTRYCPVEWEFAEYVAILATTIKGVIVVEAAGNGNQDLDDVGAYGAPFPNGLPDSGAIIVGAGGGAAGGTPPRARMDFSTHGARVNVQGWGQQVMTTGYGTAAGSDPADKNKWYRADFSGTSSASPIVASAAAMLSSVAKQQGDANGLTSVEMRSLLMSTGTAQDTGPGTLAGNIGPQPNLLEALKAWVPEADAGGPYTTPEGTNAILDASASSDPQGGLLTYEWDLDNDGDYDDATGVTATFETVGQDGEFTVGVRVTDPAGASDTDTATVAVTNVLPSMAWMAWTSPIDEGDAVSLSGLFQDPGWLDPLSLLIDWGDGTAAQDPGGTVENERPWASIEFATTHVYGDNGSFTTNVTASDDDGSADPVSVEFKINNVAPTAVIDEGGTILVNGIPTVMTHAGTTVPFSGRSTDPGSDDLALSWDWADGAPAPDVTTNYLVNPPDADPYPSPSIQPRDVTDAKEHAWSGACFYVVGFSAADDDGGVTSDTVNAIVLGNAPYALSSGYWQKQMKDGKGAAISQQQLQCYLKIVGYMSTYFSAMRDASTITKALAILNGSKKPGDAGAILDQQLLAVWLNFANGSIDYFKMIDTDGDGVDDMMFKDYMSYAETLRMNPSATKTELIAAKYVLEWINLGLD